MNNHIIDKITFIILEDNVIIKKLLLLMTIWCSLTLESLSSQESISGSDLIDLVVRNLDERGINAQPIIKTNRVFTGCASHKIVISKKNNNTSYIGFRGIKKNCLLSGDKIKMNLTVNLRSVRKNFQNDDLIKLKISLVSTHSNLEEFDRDDFELDFFLKSGSEIVERESNMSVTIPKGGKVYIGLFQN